MTAAISSLASAEARVPQRPWTDHTHWTAEVARAGTFARQQDILYRWVELSGGYVEGTVALLPTLPAGPARAALVGSLMRDLGVSARIGKASAHPDFGRELKMRGIASTARLLVHFVLDAIADRGHERVATGRVLEGGTKYAITVTTAQPLAELAALHRAGAVRVEGFLAVTHVGADVVPVRGVIMAGAS